MGTIDEIRRMQGEGKGEGEIRAALKQTGIPDSDVNDAFSQTQIKEAVASGGTEQLPADTGRPIIQQEQAPVVAPPQAPAPAGGTQEYSAQVSAQVPAQGYENMQPSMIAGGEPQVAGQEYAAQGQQQQGYSSQDQQQQGPPGVDAYSGYPSYQPYQETMSTDLITEISDQVVSERLSYLQDKMEKALSFRTVADAKINALDERLKRIEKIIDKLQLSILQKVGEYVTDVRDIKRELGEDRKSFKALHGHRKHSSHKKKHSKK